MRAVVDTNVLLSALLWHGPPHTLLQHIRDGTLAAVTSPALLAELTHAIARRKFDSILARSNTFREQLLGDLRQLTEVIEPPPLPRRVCRDPDDDAVLACAIAARSGIIVSGDQDLLVLQVFEGIPIVTSARAIEIVGGGRPG